MSFTKAALTQGERALEWANGWHQTVVLWTVAGSAFVLALAVLANMAGFPEFNFVLAAATLVIGIFFLTKPAFVLSVFGIGSLANGLPDTKLGEILRNGVGSLPNFELEKMLGAGWDAVKATTHKVAHALFLLTVILIVLGMFPIGDARFVLPALVVLTGFGLWSALFVEKNGMLWYRNITIGILIVTSGIILFKMYDHASKVERIEEARVAHQERLIEEALTPMLRKAENGIRLTKEEVRILDAAKKREENRSVLKQAENALAKIGYKKTVLYEIKSLRDGKICGIMPGTWTFSMKQSTLVTVFEEEGPNLYEINGFITVNGSPVGEKTTIGKDGCVTVSFALPEIMKELEMVPNVARLSFK